MCERDNRCCIGDPEATVLLHFNTTLCNHPHQAVPAYSIVLGVLWLIVMALLQALVFGPAWNPFAPIHDALYNIAGVPRITKDAPAPTTKGKGKSKKN